MVKCQCCGSDNESWYVFCQNCGKKIAGDKPTGAGKASTGGAAPLDSKIGSRPTQITEALLDDILPEQSTMALDESLLPKEGAVEAFLPGTGFLPGGIGKQPVMPAKDIPLKESGSECLNCHESIPAMHGFCGFCGWRIGADQPVAAADKSALEVAKSPPSLTCSSGLFMLMRVREDGSFDCGMCLREGDTLIGREAGDLCFPTDSLLSKRHARIVAEGGLVYLEDLGSTNGTFLRLKLKKQLQHGDYLLIGKQLLRFEMEAPGTGQTPASANQTLVLGSLIGKYEAKLVKRLPSGKDSNEYPLTEPVTGIGREKGEILFKNDPYVSGKHARIQLEAGSYTVEDLKSSNGTYLRMRQREEIGREDFFIVGEQLFQVRLLVR